MMGARRRLYSQLALVCIVGLLVAVWAVLIGSSSASDDGMLLLSAVADPIPGPASDDADVYIAVTSERGILQGLTEENFRVDVAVGMCIARVEYVWEDRQKKAYK